ncbi:AsmA-like C-terminal region-containing protein [Cohaesibacter haloalkalitolerans]|uniref:AsmA-like C-terminal region-containing protein n=1 Tax=Cohaesibacter haloalkalitolerans TaxID=1162980 RepID=UPI000E647A7F|nr:AsmA-like C-terminal region-containing protein [Cohaesibacter haloalkalitolerans]
MTDRLETPPDNEHPSAQDKAASDLSSSAPAVIRKPSKAKRRIMIALIALVVIVALLLGGLALRLYYAPLSISGLRDQVENLVKTTLPAGQDLQIEDVMIGLSENGRLSLQLSHVALSEGDEELLSAPKIDLELDLLALVQQQIRAKSIIILSMSVKVWRDQTGRLLIAGQDPSVLSSRAVPETRLYDPNEPQFVSAINAMRRALKPLADEDLDRRPPQILIRNTEITFHDDVLNKHKIYRNVAFAYNPLGEEDSLWRIDFAYDGRHGRIHSAMGETPLTSSEANGGGRSVQLVFENISLPDLLPRFSDETVNFNFSSAFAGRAQLDFNDKDALSGVKMVLNVGEGLLEFGEKDEAYLNSAMLRFDWVPEKRMLRLSDSHVLFGETGGAFRGVIVWPETEDGNIQVQVEANNIKLAARDNPHPSRMLQQILLLAHIERKSGIATVDDFRMVANEGSLHGSGTISQVDGEVALNMGFDISAMPYDLLLHMWPVNIANGARRWLLNHLQGGRTTGGRFDLALTESMFARNEEGRLVLPDDAVKGSFGYEDVSLKEFGDLPSSNQLAGKGTVTGRTFQTSIDAGRFVTKSGLFFPVSNGRFEIPDHSQKPATGIVSLEGEGSAVAFGEIIDSEPLNTLKKEKQKASDLSGTASAKVRLSFPFIDPLTLDDVHYDAQITLKDVASKVPLRGHEVAGADVVINTDGDRMDIKGLATIDGISAALDLSSSSDSKVVTSSSFDLLLTDADRKRLGLGLDEWLRGATSVRATQSSDAPKVIKVEADLTKAELDLNELGWSKKPNVRGAAKFELIDRGDHFEVKDLAVSGDGFEAEGSVEISKDDGLQALKLTRLELSRGDRLALDVTRNGQGPYRIAVSGDVLDLRGKLMGSPFISKEKKDESRESVILNAEIKRVIGLSGQAISGFSASAEIASGQIRQVDVRGALNGTSMLEVTTTKEKYPTLHIEALDAGALFRFLGVVDRVVGGQLALSVALQKGIDTIAGSLFLKDFQISGQVEKRQSSKSSTQNVDSGFDSFSVQYSGENGLFDISRGILKGPVLGATVDGSIDMKSRNLNVSGTYIPAYKVNNIFSRLPVIGRALGNRKNEGLLGITYVVKGNMANPTLIVNPASLLAPGVFRKIFEF